MSSQAINTVSPFFDIFENVFGSKAPKEEETFIRSEDWTFARFGNTIIYLQTKVAKKIGIHSDMPPANVTRDTKPCGDMCITFSLNGVVTLAYPGSITDAIVIAEDLSTLGDKRSAITHRGAFLASFVDGKQIGKGRQVGKFFPHYGPKMCADLKLNY